MDHMQTRPHDLTDLNALDLEILAQLCRQNSIQRLACYRINQSSATLIWDTGTEDKLRLPPQLTGEVSPKPLTRSKGSLAIGWQAFTEAFLKEHGKMRGWKIYLPVQDLWNCKLLFLAKQDGRRSTAAGSLDGFLEALGRRLHHWLATDEMRHFIDDAASLEHTHAFGSMLSQILSHEMRNPLTNLISLCQTHEMANKDLNPGESQFASEVSHYITQIWDIVQKIELLTDVDSSTFQNHEKPEPTDIQELIRRTVDTEKNNHKESSAKVILTQSPEPVMVQGVPSLLHLAIREIIKNAYDFGKDGVIKISGFQSGASFILDIEDEGMPIPPGQEELIFLRYFQGSRTLRQQSPMRRGLGLGLFLARFVSTLHAGQLLFVRGGPGRKGTFRMILPVLSEIPKSKAS